MNWNKCWLENYFFIKIARTSKILTLQHHINKLIHNEWNQDSYPIIYFFSSFMYRIFRLWSFVLFENIYISPSLTSLFFISSLNSAKVIFIFFVSSLFSVVNKDFVFVSSFNGSFLSFCFSFDLTVWFLSNYFLFYCLFVYFTFELLFSFFVLGLYFSFFSFCF